MAGQPQSTGFIVTALHLFLPQFINLILYWLDSILVQTTRLRVGVNFHSLNSLISSLLFSKSFQYMFLIGNRIDPNPAVSYEPVLVKGKGPTDSVIPEDWGCGLFLA
jgi:hypothetical protein